MIEQQVLLDHQVLQYRCQIHHRHRRRRRHHHQSLSFLVENGATDPLPTSHSVLGNHL